MEKTKIRVTTNDGPGAEPVMREVARPIVPFEELLLGRGSCWNQRAPGLRLQVGDASERFLKIYCFITWPCGYPENAMFRG